MNGPVPSFDTDRAASVTIGGMCALTNCGNDRPGHRCVVARGLHRGAADSSSSTPAPEDAAAAGQPTTESADESPDDSVADPATETEDALTSEQPDSNVRAVPVDVTYRDDEYGVEIEVQEVGLARTYTTLSLEAVNTGTEEVSLSSCLDAFELETADGIDLTFVEPGGEIRVWSG